jgi:hypothetical protein
MNSLMFLMYVTGIGVSIVLERQSKRQKCEIALECARLGLPLPPVRPRIQTLEALLSIAIGIVLLIPAVQGFWMIFSDTWFRAHVEPGFGDFYSVLIAAGVTLIFLGCKALRENLIERRDIPRPGPDTGRTRIQ